MFGSGAVVALRCTLTFFAPASQIFPRQDSPAMLARTDGTRPEGPEGTAIRARSARSLLRSPTETGQPARPEAMVTGVCS